MIITSRSNPLIKRAKSLKQKKYRDELGLFVLEGEKFVADALKAGFRCETLFCLPKFEGRYAGAKQEVLLTEEVFAALTDTRSPQGILGLFKLPSPGPEDLFSAQKILCLDDVQDSDNVGALIRSAVCAGYGAVLLSPGCADCYSQKAVRASAGAVLSIPCLRGELSLLAELRKRGYSVAGTHLCGDERAKIPGGRLVLIIGNEGRGIGERQRELCDVLLKIPIYGKCDSLNAAAAGAILMYKTIGY